MKKEFSYKFVPLKEPVLITEQIWPEGTIPLVHTRTMAFMHEDYIRDCIEGILMQKTTFPVKVLIHDDASTDKTAEIIRDYEKRYPKLIKAYYQPENSHVKPDKEELRSEFFSWRKGKYEATCEGDDYWIDPLKLQKQIDFLEKYPKYSAVFGQIRKKDEVKNTDKITRFVKRDYEMFDVLSGLMPGLQNICFRFEARKYMPDIESNGDLKIYYFCAKWGPLAYIDESFSVYRMTGKGESSGRPEEKVLEIAINHRYNLHKQLGFPNNKALIKSQIKIILPHIRRNFSLHKIIKVNRLMKTYKIKGIDSALLYMYYSGEFLAKSIVKKVLNRNEYWI